MRLPRLTMKNDHQKAVSATDAGRKCVKFISRSGRAMLALSVASCALSLVTGCDTKDWLNPTATVRSGHPQEPLVLPILSTFDPRIEASPADFATATAPRPADMMSNTEDYTIGPNDLLNISISDLINPGQETVKVLRVTESGNVSLPFLGGVHAAGLTELELEQFISQEYKKAALVTNSQVSVVVVEARGRTVEILGAVNAPGQYATLDTDFRLLDALVQAKDVTTPLVEYIYVIRKSEGHKSSGYPTTVPAPSAPDNLKPGPLKVPASGPTDDLAPHTDAGSIEPVPATKIASANHPLSLAAETPLLDERTPAARPVSQAKAPAPMVEPFAFKPPQAASEYRVIRVPYAALKAGDLSYNMAIHPRDLIIAQQLPVGEYYMGAHVGRPGVYTLSGRRITLKEAIVSAGMYDDLAIPQRTEIIRRVGPDREVFVRVDLEKIFAGETPDIYLKPNDQVMVGTNALAPWLSAVRGAFRLTYGFGFLYDRNFAYSSKTLGFLPGVGV